MNKFQYIIPLTFGEFEILRRTFRFEVPPQKIILTSADDDSLKRPEVVEQIKSNLPPLLLNEPQGALIAVFSSIQNGAPSGNPLHNGIPSRILIDAKHLQKVIPLTDDARGIIAGRLGDSVRLEPALLDDELGAYLKMREKSFSLYAADSLVEAMVENHGSFAHDHLRSALSSSNEEIHSVLGKTLVYTRYEPWENEPASALRDLGKILKEFKEGIESADTFLSDFSLLLKGYINKQFKFKETFGNPEICQALDGISEAWKLSCSALSLAIFLYWKELASRASGIDLVGLCKDCSKLAGCVEGDILANALWLLGFRSGTDAFFDGVFDYLDTEHPLRKGKTPRKRVRLLDTLAFQPSAASVGTSIPDLETQPHPVSTDKIEDVDQSTAPSEKSKAGTLGAPEPSGIPNETKIADLEPVALRNKDNVSELPFPEPKEETKDGIASSPTQEEGPSEDTKAKDETSLATPLLEDTTKTKDTPTETEALGDDLAVGSPKPAGESDQTEESPAPPNLPIDPEIQTASQELDLKLEPEPQIGRKETKSPAKKTRKKAKQTRKSAREKPGGST